MRCYNIMKNIRKEFLFGLLIALISGCENTRDLYTINYESGRLIYEETPLRAGVSGALATWGYTYDGIYGTVYTKETDTRFIFFRNWRGNVLQDPIAHEIPRSIRVVPLKDGIIGLCYAAGDRRWPYALMDLESQEILESWHIPKGWSIRCAGSSANLKFVGIITSDGIDAEDYEWPRRRSRVALIDVERRELFWLVELDGSKGSGISTVGTIVVTDDGRYVAVVGWDNGVAMVDVEKREVIWSKKPPGEYSSSYAAFSPDGKLLYAVGSASCVYVMDVATGDIVEQRWATPTGEAIYGYRATAMGLSRDGSRLSVGIAPTGDIYVWDLESNDDPVILPHGYGSLLITAFSPDATRLVTVGGGRLKLWCLDQPDDL